MAILEILNNAIDGVYMAFSNQIPQQYMPYIVLAIYTIIITVYSIFVWRFYRFLAKRNIIELNLNKYNKTEHPFLNKLLAFFLFIIEYIIIVPILVFFWFSILSIFLLLLSESEAVEQILIVSAAIIASTRMAAYYSTDLAKDLAKIFPFTVLVIFLLNPNFFSVEKLIIRFSEIPSLFSSIVVFLVFIAALEIIMRFLFTIIDLISGRNQ